MVLLDERNGRYWMVNATGAMVLRRLLSGDTVDDAVADLRMPGSLWTASLSARTPKRFVTSLS